MIDVDRTAGQYFLHKNEDIFDGNPNHVRDREHERKEDLFTILRKRKDYEDTRDYLLSLLTESHGKNHNFDCIRTYSKVNCITCDSEMDMFATGLIDNFALGVLCEIPEHIRCQKMEQMQSCPRCGDPMVPTVFGATGLCRSCYLEAENEKHFKESREKLDN